MNNVGEAGATLDFEVHFARGTAGKRVIRRGAEPALPPVSAGHVPRLSRLMALAIRFDEMIQRGEAEDFAQLADLGHVTRARMSQIIALLSLAPDIQEEILFLPLVRGDREAVSEREIRPVVAEPTWGKQRAMWRSLQG